MKLKLFFLSLFFSPLIFSQSLEGTTWAGKDGDGDFTSYRFGRGGAVSVYYSGKEHKGSFTQSGSQISMKVGEGSSYEEYSGSVSGNEMQGTYTTPKGRIVTWTAMKMKGYLTCADLFAVLDALKSGSIKGKQIDKNNWESTLTLDGQTDNSYISHHLWFYNAHFTFLITASQSDARKKYKELRQLLSSCKSKGWHEDEFRDNKFEQYEIDNTMSGQRFAVNFHKYPDNNKVSMLIHQNEK